jgi:uncharacterized protein YggE
MTNHFIYPKEGDTMQRQGFNVLLCICLFILLAINTVRAENHQDDRRGTISVTGAASENYPPDTAEIILATENTSMTVSQATQKNNTVTEKVISRLKTIIKPEEGDTIKTSSYSLQPAYEYDQTARKNKLIGYRVTNQITVKTRQITNAGKFIDSATEEGANRVDNISFTISDNRDFCKLLLRRATERAKSEAEVVAQSLGTKIAGVKEVSSSCGSEMPRPVYRFGMVQEETMTAKSAAPVEAGTIVLQGSVRAVFYLDSL